MNSGDDRDKDKRRDDPWSSPEQGPPDLDEALNKMRDQLRGIFGGKGGGGQGGGGRSGGGPGISSGVIGMAVVVLLAIWLFAGIYQVDEKERGVILRLGKYHETVGPGLHWNPLLIDQRFTVLVTQEQDYSSRGLMLTQDENIVEVPISVQYNIPDPKAFILNVKDPITSLKHATDSALRHVVGSTKSNNVLSDGRELMAEETKQRLQTYLDSYQTGIAITRVNILKAEPPSAVKSAFDDVIAAKEDKERFVNEAEAYANGIVPESRGKAQRILQEAIGYRDRLIAEALGDAQRFDQLFIEYRKAPKVTRERLYLDAVEQVMKNSSKILVDVEGGNNMMYLPLDKLASQSSAQETSASAQPELASKIAREVLDQLRREQSRSRRSEGR
ncbi:MAG: FtsH protease activity modulator HflK [Gammaproteobacteria bacterium]|nr:FtsH protease activity modulator HflK [Gammaproteobacteria bacterium]NND39000.1 FtsH protease activity modulator HflK [Pseudomonadales bacterium]NNM11988.1 FtsH protease activity modulator HflK [Pseudomonadales bacterium]RZV57615.1 MAG: FtsH protease activity modulator HflK [Pseudomonadales bacterium]